MVAICVAARNVLAGQVETQPWRIRSGRSHTEARGQPHSFNTHVLSGTGATRPIVRCPMSTPDRMPAIAMALREEIVDALTETITDVIARLSPAARLRLVAFLHLLDRPEAALADLDVDQSGIVRLTLANMRSGD